MITVQVYTNLSNNEVTKTFENHLSAGISKILDKPIIEKITVLVNFDKRICEGGQDVPMMMLQLNAVDRFNQTENSGYIEQLIIMNIKVHLTDIKVQMIGNGKT